MFLREYVYCCSASSDVAGLFRMQPVAQPQSFCPERVITMDAPNRNYYLQKSRLFNFILLGSKVKGLLRAANQTVSHKVLIFPPTLGGTCTLPVTPTAPLPPPLLRPTVYHCLPSHTSTYRVRPQTYTSQ
jgi:hypothetical protein